MEGCKSSRLCTAGCPLDKALDRCTFVAKSSQLDFTSGIDRRKTATTYNVGDTANYYHKAKATPWYDSSRIQSHCNGSPLSARRHSVAANASGPLSTCMSGSPESCCAFLAEENIDTIHSVSKENNFGARAAGIIDSGAGSHVCADDDAPGFTVNKTSHRGFKNASGGYILADSEADISFTDNQIGKRRYGQIYHWARQEAVIFDGHDL